MTGEYTQHDACPGTWCTTVACVDCGEMLTNPQPCGGGVFKGICSNHGRGSAGVVMRRADCMREAALHGRSEQ